jgi:hypothetical protein
VRGGRLGLRICWIGGADCQSRGTRGGTGTCACSREKRLEYRNAASGDDLSRITIRLNSNSRFQDGGTSSSDEFVDVSHVPHILHIIILPSTSVINSLSWGDITVRGAVYRPRVFDRTQDRPCWRGNALSAVQDHLGSASGP